MIEQILDFIGQLTPIWLYVVLFLFSYVENIFPPSPSDLVLVVGGSLVATGSIHYIPVLILTTLGSTLGFMTLYWIGVSVDKKLLRSGKIKFISLEGVEKAEKWFAKYGYKIILINRFLPGTRSVISFFAGVSELDVKRILTLSTISAVVWNAIIIYLGWAFGNNIAKVDEYLSAYSNIVLIITIAAVVIGGIYYWYTKRKKKV